MFNQLRVHHEQFSLDCSEPRAKWNINLIQLDGIEKGTESLEHKLEMLENM